MKNRAKYGRLNSGDIIPVYNQNTDSTEKSFMLRTFSQNLARRAHGGGN